MAAASERLYVSRSRDLTFPQVTELPDGLIEYQSKAPAFIAPLTPEERTAFMDAVLDPTVPLGVYHLPDTFDSLVTRMIAMGKSLYSFLNFSKHRIGWYVIDHDIDLTNYPHPENYIPLKVPDVEERLLPYYPSAFQVKMTVAASENGKVGGTVLYPSTYTSRGQVDWVHDVRAQATGRRNIVKTPELTIVGFTGTDAHSSPAFEDVRRGLLSVTLYPKPHGAI